MDVFNNRDVMLKISSYYPHYISIKNIKQINKTTYYIKYDIQCNNSIYGILCIKFGYNVTSLTIFNTNPKFKITSSRLLEYKNLTHLDISNTQINFSENNYKLLENLKSLINNKIVDISKFKNLTSLDNSRSNNNNGLCELRNLIKLECNYNTSNRDLIKLTNLTKLSFNNIPCQYITINTTDAYILNKTIKNLINLEELYCNIKGCKLNDGLKYLKKLKILHFQNNKSITNEIIASLPNLTDIKCNNIITDDCLYHLNLKKIYLEKNKKITAKYLTEDLIVLDLGYNINFTNSDIKKLTNLTELNLGKTKKIKINRLGIEYLTKLKTLSINCNYDKDEIYNNIL
jgi:hypothetical protein